MFIALNRDKVAFFWNFQGILAFSIQSSHLLLYHFLDKIDSFIHLFLQILCGIKRKKSKSR